MDSITLRKLYLDFFKERGHAVISGASLIPENDPTVLFTTAGMHPLVPYLCGEKHPQGTRLTDVQKCVRTGDIDEVGDATHCTFFEMLGNWSLGDYFKKEAISWSYEFLTKVLKIDVTRLAVSVFAGDETAPRDSEAASIWERCGIPKDRIFYLPKKNNWWGPAGQTGPCGTDTEMFIDTGKPKCSEECSPACDCGKYIEIWNDVFMQYNKQADGSFAPLAQKNVDTGMGLERTLCILNGYKSVYETDLFEDGIKKLEEL
ncbi:MAG: alanine--tRNA ligase, partial [Clostridia bacterium]|nr:alanine--tRNA ligase [Clostridia bacterium]